MPAISACGQCGGTGSMNLRFAGMFPEYSGNCHSGRCEPCSQLSRIQERLEEARRVLDQVLMERDAMVEAINRRHDPLAQRFPAEIASDILFHCLPPQPFLDVFEKEATDCDMVLVTTLKLGQVCHRWRTVSHSTPKLWSVLPITVSPRKHRDPRVLQAWLERSASLSLFFQLKVNNQSSASEFPELSQLITQISNHRHRVKGLDIRTSPKIISSLFRSSALSSIRLQTLSIWAQDRSSIPADLEVAPVSLRLQKYRGTLRIQDWSNLTEVHFHDIFDSQYIEILRQALNLKICVLDNVHNEIVQFEPLVHFSLRELSIDNVRESFWDQVSFPALEELGIFAVNDKQYEWTRVRDFLVRSACSLVWMQISEEDVSETDLISILELTPTLKELYMDNLNLSDRFWRRATASTVTAGFLPNLLIICYNFPPDHSFGWDIIAPFLESRGSSNEEGLPLFRSLILVPVQGDDDSQGPHDTAEIDEAVWWRIIDASQHIRVSIYDAEGNNILKGLRLRNLGHVPDI